MTMQGADSFDFFSQMKEDDIILSFRGPVGEELLTALYQAMEKNDTHSGANLKLRKRIYYILVECLQNIFHHTRSSGGRTQEDSESILLVSKTEDGGYRILTGNYIASDRVEILRQKIEEVNSYTEEQLKEVYRNKLSTTELSEKGGAGLGFLDMARKSDGKLDYAFHPVKDGIHFFSFSVIIH